MGAYSSGMAAKAGSFVVAFLVLFGAPDKLWSAAPEDRHAWQEKYRRPAEIPFPPDNPYSDAKFRLGRILFFDPILSGSEVRSCASCHNTGLSWGDGQKRAIGEKQEPLPLRSPTLLNVAWTPKLGWDGHFRNLEGEITAREIEMALATFERSIVSKDAPFDRWINGDETAIDKSAKNGFDLF